MRHDSEWAQRAQRELRALLNEWDPVGVFDPEDGDDESWPVDEYDCIRDPLISHLLRGYGRDDVAAFLRDELTSHFGLEPWIVTTNIIDQIFGWWESAK